MPDQASDPKFNPDDLDQLADETGDERFAELAAALRELTADDERDRDRLIHEMADRHFATVWSYRGKAAEMDLVARRYLAGPRWLRVHSDRLRLPDEIRGTPAEFVWRVMKAADRFPGYDRLRKILRNP